MWPEVAPLSSASSTDVAHAFLSAGVALFSTPSDITCYRGSQFFSEFWSLGVQVHHTTTYHPQANGLCEHFHWSQKVALHAALADASWVDCLPWVAFSS